MRYLCVLEPVSSDTVAEEEEGNGLNCVDDAVSSERNGVTAGARELGRRRSRRERRKREREIFITGTSLYMSLLYVHVMINATPGGVVTMFNVSWIPLLLVEIVLVVTDLKLYKRYSIHHLFESILTG